MAGMRSLSVRTAPNATRLIQRGLPWSISLLLHALLILIGFVVTWTIVREDTRPPSPVVTGSHESFTPLAPLHDPPSVAMQTMLPSTPSVLTEVKVPSSPSIDGPAPSMPSVLPDATFAGMSLDGGQDLVFVIDASGSMIPWLPFILDEVERSLAALRADQRFALICFAGTRLHQVPEAGLMAASAAQRAASLAALRRTVASRPGGGSNPIAALREACNRDPDQIILLSEGLDGRGRFALDREATLEALDEINPRRGGHRGARIDCVQLVVSDREVGGRLMEAIAADHAGTITRVSLEDLNP